MKMRTRTIWLDWLNRVSNNILRARPKAESRSSRLASLARTILAQYSSSLSRRIFGSQGLGPVDSVSAFLNNGDAAKELFFRDAANQVVDNHYYFLNRQEMDTQENNPAIGGGGVTEDISKICVTRDKNKRFLFYKIVDFFVRGIWFNIANIQNLVAGFFNSVANRAWTVCINKEFHRLFGRLADKFLFVSQECSIKYTGLDTFGCKRRKFLFDLFKVHSGGQCFENDIYRRTRSFYARFSMLNLRIYADMFCKISLINHFIFSYILGDYIIGLIVCQGDGQQLYISCNAGNVKML